MAMTLCEQCARGECGDGSFYRDDPEQSQTIPLYALSLWSIRGRPPAKLNNLGLG